MSEKFSYSRIDTYQQCGFKYKLQYVDKNYVYLDSIATKVGTMIHAAEEAIAKALMQNEEIPYLKLRNDIILQTYKLEHDFPDTFHEVDKSGRFYKQKISDYLNSGIYRLERFIKLHTGYQIVAAEKYFEFTFENVGFKGFIDRIIYDSIADRYIIQDIKTYAIPLTPSELKNTPLQFVVYTLAFANMMNIPPERISCQYDLPFCDKIQDAGQKAVGQEDRDKLKVILFNIFAEDFKPKATPLCAWCPYSTTNPVAPETSKYLCPYHSLWTKESKAKGVAAKWEGLDKHEIVLQKYLEELHVK